MRLTRVNERRNNRGGGPVLLVAITAIVIVVILVLAYWFLIRSAEESTALTTDDSKAVSTQTSTVVPTIVPTVSVPPTTAPTIAPAVVPTAVPTIAPTLAPTPVPTAIPTAIPTAVPDPTPLPATSLPLPEVVNDNPPHVFVGTVTIDGGPAPEGTEVTAWVLKYSDPVGKSIVPSVVSNPGSYSLLVPQHGKDFTGTVLMIKVNGNFVKNVIWKSGEGDLLDLAQ